jgi:hypothetical protein
VTVDVVVGGKNVRITKLFERLSHGFPRRGGDRDSIERVPGMLWLRGERAAALVALDRAVVELGERRDPFATEAREFARLLHEKRDSTQHH